MTGSPVQDLVDLLRQAGLKPTLDFERSNSKPCICCGAEGPNPLVHVGSYIMQVGGNLGPRDAMTRPFCVVCDSNLLEDRG